MELTLIALVGFNQGLRFCAKRRELRTQQNGIFSCGPSIAVEDRFNEQEQRNPGHCRAFKVVV